MLLHVSPTATAMKLRVHCGPRAEQLVERWIVSLVRVSPLPITGIGFWCDVGTRLSGLQLSECEPHVKLSAFDRTRYDTMLARVGMKKGGYPLGGSPVSRHLKSARSARRSQC